MAIELVRSAPGVRAISSRLISVVGVAVLTFAAWGVPLISVVASTVARASSKWSTAVVSEARVSVAVAPRKPGALTEST